MNGIFRNHLVVCNWNRRGPTVIKALRSLSTQPIIIICQDINKPLQAVGKLDNVFILAGDPTSEKSLQSADVAFAQSVLVLADDHLGASADAQSVKIALLVESIQVTVYTVVELLDINNKSHFSWTKVDDLIADEELTIRLFAQGIKHLAIDANSDSQTISAMRLLAIYHQLVDASRDHAQLFRVSLAWEKAATTSFKNMFTTGLDLGVLPCALVGYMRHEISSSDSSDAWVSWKTDIYPNPPADKTIQEIWPEWPDRDYELGIIIFARNLKQALTFQSALRSPAPGTI